MGLTAMWLFGRHAAHEESATTAAPIEHLEDVLCTPTSSPAEREAAAEKLARQHRLGQVLGSPRCPPASRITILERLASPSFERVCGQEACIDVYLGLGGWQAIGPFIAGHRREILAAVVRHRVTPAEAPFLSGILYSALADEAPQARNLAPLVAGTPPFPPAVVLLADAAPETSKVAGVLRGVRDHGPPEAASLARLLLDAAGRDRLAADAMAAALEGVDCPLFAALAPKLGLADAARADAAAPAVRRCPEQAFVLYESAGAPATTPKILDALEPAVVERMTRSSIADRLLVAFAARPKPPLLAIRTLGNRNLEPDELRLALGPPLDSKDAAVLAAAAAALAQGGEDEIPREAAAACAREQKAASTCAPGTANCPKDVCGGEPLRGESRARLAKAAGLEVPEVVTLAEQDANAQEGDESDGDDGDEQEEAPDTRALDTCLSVVGVCLGSEDRVDACVRAARCKPGESPAGKLCCPQACVDKFVAASGGGKNGAAALQSLREGPDCTAAAAE